MLIKFVGDIHGNYAALINHANVNPEIPTVQVGDFGAGFIPVPELPENVSFIRGNHDNPEVCKNHPQWIPDGYYADDILYIGGGYSIDRDIRTIGVDLFEDEELSYGELGQIIDKAIEKQPKMIVSHECPISAMPKSNYIKPSRTANALETIFNECQPKVWIFGHHHKSWQVRENGTLFICVNIDEAIIVDLNFL